MVLYHLFRVDADLRGCIDNRLEKLRDECRDCRPRASRLSALTSCHGFHVPLPLCLVHVSLRSDVASSGPRHRGYGRPARSSHNLILILIDQVESPLGSTGGNDIIQCKSFCHITGMHLQFGIPATAVQLYGRRILLHVLLVGSTIHST